AHEVPRTPDGEAADRRRSAVACERSEDLRLHLRPDAGHLAQPSGARGFTELGLGADAERRADSCADPGAEPEELAERGELGRQSGAELLELGDASGLDELDEPALDSGPDPTQLPDPAFPHEPCDRELGGNDQLSRATVS